jgi:hypothetical protein
MIPTATAASPAALSLSLARLSALEMVEDLIADKTCPRLVRHRQQGGLRPAQRAEDRGLVALGSCARRGDCLVRRSLHLGARRFRAGLHADPTHHADYHDADLNRRLGRARSDDDGRVWLRGARSD